MMSKFAPNLNQSEHEWCAAKLLAGIQFEEKHEQGMGIQTLRAAIACYIQAKDKIGEESREPKLWAATHLNLGVAYDKLAQTEPGARKLAITAFETALSVPGVDFVGMAAGTYGRLAELILEEEQVAVLHRFSKWAGPSLTSQREIDHAIALASEMCKRIDRQRSKRIWLCAMLALANLYRNSVDAKNSPQERAIALYREALAAFTETEFPDCWGGFMGELGHTLSIYRSGDRAKNVEEAIEACSESARSYSAHGNWDGYATTMASMCNAYLERVVGERADNIERAIQACTESLRVRKENQDPSAVTLALQLAEAYMLRLEGDRSDNVEHALSLLTPLLKGVDWGCDADYEGHLQSQLGKLYLERIAGDPEKNLEMALQANIRAEEIARREPGSRNAAIAAMNIGSVYLLRAGNARQAITYSKKALDVLSEADTPLDWADCKNNLGLAYQMMADGEADSAASSELAVNSLHDALRIRTIDQFPKDHRRIQQNLGRLHFGQRQWEPALAAYLAAMQAGQRLLEAAFTETGRRSEIETDAVCHANAAYCLLKLGRWRESFETLDSGRTRLLTSTLALGDSELDILSADTREQIQRVRLRIRGLEAEMRQQLGVASAGNQTTRAADALRIERAELTRLIAGARRDAGDFMPGSPPLKELIASIPADGVLIAPLITNQGGAVFVIPHATHSLDSSHVLWLDKTDALTLPERCATCEAVEADDLEALRMRIEHSCVALWHQLMGPVLQRMADLSVPAGASLILMPQARLSQLPLHAACREVAGMMRSVSDDYAVTWIPSGYALVRCTARAAEPQRAHRRLLAVVDPNDDLPFARQEGDAVAAHFDAPDATILAGAAATPPSVKVASAHINYLHFCCHATYNLDNPLLSRLQLAGTLSLSMAKVFETFDLGSTRLVVLSACATGLSEAQRVPDEFVGLSTEFLQAGSPAILSTLWAVSDFSAMLFIEHFYGAHLHAGLSLGRALQAAQTWMKEVTAAEMAARMAAQEDRLFERGGPELRLAALQFGYFAGLPAQSRPFAHPYHWGAFVLNGA